METAQTIVSKMKIIIVAFFFSAIFLFISMTLMIFMVLSPPVSDDVIILVYLVGSLLFLTGAVKIYIRTAREMSDLEGRLNVLIPREFTREVSKQD